MKKYTAIFFAVIFLGLIGKAHAFTTSGFSNPYGAAIDEKTGFIYVSNINGDPNSADDNGFISRLKSDGSVDQLRFIDGAAPNIVLNAPKGMAILGNSLYVCDLDTLHTYDLTTGKLLFDVNFGELPREHFYEVTIGPDGALYLTDAAKNIIYRIDISKQHEVTQFIAGDELGSPHGIIWYAARQLFVISGSTSGQLTTYDRSGKRQSTPGVFLKSPEGLDDDDGGNIYVASRELGAVYRLAPTFALNGYQVGLTTPNGVTYNRGTKSIIVTSVTGNTVQSFPIAP